LCARGRHAVRRATREGCEVKRVELTDENMRAMYALMDTVGQGKVSLLLRPYEYYRDFWRAFENAGQGRLYFTYEDGKPSVGAYVINYGTKGTYKDGGSKPRRKQYGDSHLVQWTAITDLMKEHGISTYDFCGTPPAADLKKKELLSEREYHDALEKYGNTFRVGMGAAAGKMLPIPGSCRSPTDRPQ